MSAERGTPERLQELWVLLAREDAEAAGELWACREAWQRDKETVADLYEALEGLLGTVLAAIQTGDWMVDGACEPDQDIRKSVETLAKARGVHDE